MNNQVCRGPEEVRAYFDRMLKGPDSVLKSVRFDIEVDRLTDLYGDTGLAFGDSNAVYVMRNGMESHPDPLDLRARAPGRPLQDRRLPGLSQRLR